MTESKHTPGRLWSTDCGWSDREAARLAACWKACEGVELLEAGVLKRVCDANTALRAQRDELVSLSADLLADLLPTPKSECGCCSEGDTHCSRCCPCGDCAMVRIEGSERELRAAIAKAERKS